MFRRRSKNDDRPVTPTHPWSARMDAARATVAEHAPASAVVASLDDVVRRLLQAEDDRQRLRSAVDRLDHQRTSRELKDALRAESDRPGSVAESHLTVLRERYAAVNRLLDRIDDLGQRIETAVLDAELLSVTTMEAAALGGDVDSRLADPLERLRIDVEALAAAHAEVDAL